MRQRGRAGQGRAGEGWAGGSATNALWACTNVGDWRGTARGEAGQGRAGQDAQLGMHEWWTLEMLHCMGCNIVVGEA